MSSAPPVALRLRRPRWRDPRLLIGLALVLGSVLSGSFLISRLAATTPVLVARDTVVVGDVLAPEDFTVMEVRLGDQQGRYISTTSEIPQGAIAARSVGAGELLPRAAVGQTVEAPLRPVVIPVDATVAQSVTPGGTVELWSTPQVRSGEAPKAQRLVESGVVRRVESGSTLGMRSMTVEVLVPAGQLPAVLEAMAREDRLDVVGVPTADGAATP
ncbi:flagellar biosynthesis protein FlgA [Brachybacterium sp. EF45031]|uniref:flagellar biosynthesis protein FlgA n=1 Tax=Brachybacterium sillae TaxID=2810536 RepID=UPI00217D4254|nr:flagellar biosynthesis protein FlgA [Brachybacterium sillae]MCS6711001.1 flagellar biosynthesis protein FlgA [Brachybacterium sillae]